MADSGTSSSAASAVRAPAIAECAVNLPMWDFLEEHGYNTALRGEQIYCVANKRADASIVRYPDFLYAN
jgi:hypothetical protein